MNQLDNKHCSVFFNIEQIIDAPISVNYYCLTSIVHSLCHKIPKVLLNACNVMSQPL